jgi:TonB family protein
MDRLQKRCLIASLGMHALLALLVVSGSAFFFVPKKDKVMVARLRLVPTRLVDNPNAGGGGNPNIRPSDAQKKGDTLVPQPPKAVQPPPPKQRDAQPAKKPVKKTSEVVKSPKDSDAKSDKNAPLDLKPVNRSSKARERARQEAGAREAAAAGQKMADRIGSVARGLTEGFSGGTAVEVYGPGGEATADYAAFVVAVYEHEWDPSKDLIEEGATVKVSVTIARDGQVIAKRIIRSSGNSVLDRSVQRTLDKVKFIHEFPEGSQDEQRTYEINFNLNAKRLTG